MTTGNVAEGPIPMVDQAMGLLGEIAAEIHAAMNRLKQLSAEQLTR